MQNKVSTEFQQEENYFDFENAFSAKELPMIKKLQNNAKNHADKATNTNSVLDKDIYDWLSQQDMPTKNHINGLLRHIMDMNLRLA